MAVNFPNTPTLGQTVTVGNRVYAWNGVGWEIPTSPSGGGAGGGGASVTTDDIAPTLPKDGDMWLKTTTGVLYVYYDDGNSKQWVQVSAAPQMVDQNYSRKTARRANLAINGALNVSQENGNTEGTVTGWYAADQFKFDLVAATAAVGFARITAANQSGSQFRLRFRVITAKASLAVGDIVLIDTTIEGLNAQDLNWSGAVQKDAVLQFGFNGPAGTYCASIRNAASTHSFVASFTIAAGQANTDTLQTIKVPAPVGMTTWPADNTVAIYLSIALASGTTYLAPATGWNSGNFVGVTGMSNGLAAVQSFQIWDIGLYADPDKTGLAPPFEIEDYATTLAKCCRYYENTVTYGVAYTASGSAVQRAQCVYKTQKRINPTAALNMAGGSATLPTVASGNVDVLWIGFTSTGASIEGFFQVRANARM